MVSVFWEGSGVCVIVFIRKGLPEFHGLIVPFPAGLRKQLVGVQWKCKCADEKGAGGVRERQRGVSTV